MVGRVRGLPSSTPSCTTDYCVPCSPPTSRPHHHQYERPYTPSLFTSVNVSTTPASYQRQPENSTQPSKFQRPRSSGGARRNARCSGHQLAKVDNGGAVAATSARAGSSTPIVALIESAAGIRNAASIVETQGTFRLAFGVGDFRRDTGMSDDPQVLAYPRSCLVLASRGGYPGRLMGRHFRERQMTYVANAAQQ